MFEVFEHTADLGLRIRAGDLPTLMAEAGRALFSVIVADLGKVELRQRVTLHVSFDEHPLLLQDWLSELLFLFESRQIVLTDFQVSIADGELTATVAGEELNPARHQLQNEVKAITYHGLLVEQVDGGWLAEVILDI
ncbi:MAG: archease [Planctomycetota bacterium]|nr:MAG: archease [Planctomycetota bacterium]REK24906.1 MAG: archease [Planctomycetota bacterium]REK48495.1 MAG: archease [Planctomycetota bacterium]